jgi:hypothetical protein
MGFESAGWKDFGGHPRQAPKQFKKETGARLVGLEAVPMHSLTGSTRSAARLMGLVAPVALE